MFAQLGTTIFDGLKSFVSFSNDEDVVLVEHALINRKPKLQGAGIGLQNISINLFLHQEFCVVKDEIDKLRNSKNTYEILPLLWGNGTVEGSYVIAQMSIQNQIQDGLGNLYACGVSLSLKESVADNVSKSSGTNSSKGFASGNTKPVTKSKRKNPVSCSRKLSDVLSDLQSNAARVDEFCRKYAGTQSENVNIITACSNINHSSTQIRLATKTEGTCVNGNSNMGNSAGDVNVKSSAIITDANNVNPSSLKTNNASLQILVKKLSSSFVETSKTAILKG